MTRLVSFWSPADRASNLPYVLVHFLGFTTPYLKEQLLLGVPMNILQRTWCSGDILIEAFNCPLRLCLTG